MDADVLQTLLAVLDRGSLAAAAEAIGVPRSTVRRRLERLEARLGIELFVRDARGATPTPAAHALAERARPLLRQLDALVGDVQQVTGVGAGSVHLLVPPGMPPEATLLGLAQARHAFPGVRFELSHGLVGAELPAGVDLALHFGGGPPRGPYRTRVLARLPVRLLASPGLLDARGAPATAAALADWPLLVWRPPDGDGRRLPLRAGGALPVEPVLVSPDIHLLRSAAAAGLGIALLPDPPLPPGVGVDGLVPVLEEAVGEDCALRLVVPEASAEMPRTRLALSLVEELLAQLGV